MDHRKCDRYWEFECCAATEDRREREREREKGERERERDKDAVGNPSMYTEEELLQLKRAQLQALAKEHGVKANAKVGWCGGGVT